MTRSRTLTTIGAVALAAAAIGGSATLSGAATTKSVAVDDDFFSAKKATISKNTTVTWRWRGESPHNVTPTGSKKFKKSTTKTSGTHKVKFTSAGTFRYVCTIHDGMTGSIVVK